MLEFLHSICVLVGESDTHTHDSPMYVRMRTGTHPVADQSVLNIVALWRGRPCCPPPSRRGQPPDTHTQGHGHMLTHTFSPPSSCFFIVPPVTLSYSFNLSLEPADSPVCVCTASGTMPKKPHCHSY